MIRCSICGKILEGFAKAWPEKYVFLSPEKKACIPCAKDLYNTLQREIGGMVNENL